MKYTSRGLRRRRGTDKWEVTLTHKDLSGDHVPSCHTVEAKTQRQVGWRRDELIMELELEGAAADTNMTIREFLDNFLEYKERAAIIEASTLRGYRHEAKLICKYVGDVKLSELGIPHVNDFMARMTADGYSPKSVQGAFRLFKQSLKWAMAQDVLTKNPCDYCKPPKRVKTPINTLNRADRSRMLELARAAQPQPLALAIELALTTGMRHTFATMMIASGTDVRTVANYLGHSNVAMTLNTYADVDPDAKRLAVCKVESAFDVDMSRIIGESMDEPEPEPVLALTFTAEQLRAMLAEAERREKGVA